MAHRRLTANRSIRPAPLAGSVLIESHGEWQVSDHRYLSEASMAQIGATDTNPSKEVAVPELIAS